MSKKKYLSFNKFCRLSFSEELKGRFSSGKIKGEEEEYIENNQHLYQVFKINNRKLLNKNWKDFKKAVESSTKKDNKKVEDDKESN